MPKSLLDKKYFVNIAGKRESFDRFEDAARSWDRQTFNRPAPVGGIEVQEFQNGVMVRDGWVVNVDSTGSVYINPLGA